MNFSERQMQDIMNQIKQFTKVKQVFGQEQRSDGDIYFKGIGFNRESYTFRYKSQTGNVFRYEGGAWKSIKGLMISIISE